MFGKLLKGFGAYVRMLLGGVAEVPEMLWKENHILKIPLY